MLTIGDVVEWAAGGLLVAAAWLAGGDAAGLALAGVFTFYQAQCLAGSSLNFHFRKRSKNEDER